MVERKGLLGYSVLVSPLRSYYALIQQSIAKDWLHTVCWVAHSIIGALSVTVCWWLASLVGNWRRESAKDCRVSVCVLSLSPICHRLLATHLPLHL